MLGKDSSHSFRMTMRVISNPSRKILRVKLRERSFFNAIFKEAHEGDEVRERGWFNFFSYLSDLRALRGESLFPHFAPLRRCSGHALREILSIATFCIDKVGARG